MYQVFRRFILTARHPNALFISSWDSSDEKYTFHVVEQNVPKSRWEKYTWIASLTESVSGAFPREAYTTGPLLGQGATPWEKNYRKFDSNLQRNTQRRKLGCKNKSVVANDFGWLRIPRWTVQRGRQSLYFWASIFGGRGIVKWFAGSSPLLKFSSSGDIERPKNIS